MFGSFLINPEKEVCLALINQEDDIKSILITENMLCIAALSDGTEELFTEEIDHRVFTPLSNASKILIAHLNLQGELDKEYMVSIVKQ